MTCQLVLASSSPRRAALLRQIGIRFEVRAPCVQEQIRPWESPSEYAVRTAIEKAEVDVDSPLPRLAADTVVVYRGVLFGKPSSRESGMDMLKSLAGDVHTVVTAVAMAQHGEIATKVSLSRIWLQSLTESEIGAYWDTGEPLDKAGGYGIQGVGGVLIDRIEGSPSGVAGLPLRETEALLQNAGINTWAYRNPGSGGD